MHRHPIVFDPLQRKCIVSNYPLKKGGAGYWGDLELLEYEPHANLLTNVQKREQILGKLLSGIETLIVEGWVNPRTKHPYPDCNMPLEVQEVWEQHEKKTRLVIENCSEANEDNEKETKSNLSNSDAEDRNDASRSSFATTTTTSTTTSTTRMRPAEEDEKKMGAPLPGTKLSKGGGDNTIDAADNKSVNNEIRVTAASPKVKQLLRMLFLM